MAAAARDLPLPSPSLPSRPARSSNRPFARQLEVWGGGEVWARAWAWGRQGLGFGMQGFRPKNLDPQHTFRLESHVPTRDGKGNRHPSSVEEDLQGLGWIGKEGRGRETGVALGWGGRVTNNSSARSPGTPPPRASQSLGWGRGQLSEDASVAQSRRSLYF